MNRNENETESFAGNFAASKKQRLFFEVPKREYAPTQTGSAICWPLKAVVIECCPPRTERLSQRAKKL